MMALKHRQNNVSERVFFSVMASLVLMAAGCHSITGVRNSIPANRLDPHLFGTLKDGQVPIMFSALGQEKPDAYRVGPGDTLAVFVFGVLPPSTDETPVLSQYQTLNQRYYPPSGSIVSPSTGLPMTVGADGSLEMPLVGRLSVSGLTVEEIIAKIKEAYRAHDVVIAGRERVSVAMITQRVQRVVVLRQDTPNPAVALTPPGVVDQIHRGSGEVIDLPAYENDVLHALAATGGLPGTDGVREIWVMRNCAMDGTVGVTEEKLNQIVDSYSQASACGPSVLRIPLYSYPGEPLPFSPKDVVLNAGDVVYVPRRQEYFYTGGLLNGAKIPLPQNEDPDIIQAIAMAVGSVGGPMGQGGGTLSGSHPGWFIKPTRAVVIRKMPDGSQISIRVDLARAMEDKKERIRILPDDLVMLHFKPSEGTVNAVLNFFTFNFTAPVVF